jgi:hypothetical protein
VPLPTHSPYPIITSPDEKTFVEDVKETRHQLLDNGRFDILLAAMGRPEKMDDHFLLVLSKILKKHPETRFLWFGQAYRQDIQDKINYLGIAEQCKFCGWVDTKIYVAIIDIHLDTFGTPAGLTMLDTFWHGGAYVSLKTRISARLGPMAALSELTQPANQGQEIKEALRIFQPPTGEGSLLMLATDDEEYIDLTSKLITDASLRKQVGDAIKHYMNRYFSDIRRTGEGFFLHLDNFLQAKHPTDQAAQQNLPLTD